MTDQCDFLLPQFPAYSFDENLRELAQNHQDFESYILKIKELISKSPSDQNKILLYENLGLALRVVRLLFSRINQELSCICRYFLAYSCPREYNWLSGNTDSPFKALD